MPHTLIFGSLALLLTAGCGSAGLAESEPAGFAESSSGAEESDNCPGGISSDGDCCVNGVACGATCISANSECYADDVGSAGEVTTVLVHTTEDVPAGRPDSGYRVHLIDVGTGLAILIQGEDFTMLYDGGSGDDTRGISSSANNSRLLAYLWHAVGASGPADCAPSSLPNEPREVRPELAIDHVVLSHPHQDHGVFLDEVLHCYAVNNVWDSGAVNDTVFYQRFVEAVAAEAGVTYRTARDVDTDIVVNGQAIAMGANVTRRQFSAGDELQLAAGAQMTVLHADGEQHGDPNENSIVIRLDLGDTSMLLTGDAESGPRADPSAPLGDIEEDLVANWSQQLDVDILQVGHHGSMTSSRREFLEAVSPRIALIGAGPKNYSGVVLPDQVVIDELEAVMGPDGQILRTDTHDGDGTCPAADRVGSDGGRPGGCDNWVVTMP